MIEVGNYAIDLIKNEKVQIIEHIELWGFLSYKVFNPTNNSIYKLSAEQVDKCENAKKIDMNYIRYMCLLAKIRNETSHGILSNLASGIIPLPHQLYSLNRAVSNNNIRYILADEVGLGKTIEAGLIIKELKARGLIKRILVVCPTGLVTQWKAEMQEKFGEKFQIIYPSEFRTIRKITDSDDVYGQFDNIISPMDSIKPLEKRAGWTPEQVAAYNEERIYSIVNSGFDMIIIDEAHRTAGSSSDVARHKLGDLLSKSSPYLLLLTATPHSGKTEPFLRLVRLVDEKAFPNYKAIVKEQVAPYLIRTEKREAIDNNGNPLFKNRVTKIIEVAWEDKHSVQRELYERVSKYVREGYNRAIKTKKYYIGFLMVLMQRLVTSSTSAIIDSIEKRVGILENDKANLKDVSLEDLADNEIEECLENVLSVMSIDINKEIEELKEILAIAKQAKFQYLDAKVDILSEVLEGFSEDKKTIIFTEFISTQNYLNEFLKNKGYKTCLLNGGMNIDDRNVVINEFKTKSNILISTDAGGEGINLQFANIVINYDLPWNPMKIEQRIGRIDRIGQTQDVFAYNFVITDTIENRVRTVLEEKLKVILSETGMDKLSDVLDGEIAEIDFTDTYISSIKNPKNIDFNASKIENDLKEKLQSVERFRDIIKDEKDLSNSYIDETSFNLDIALKDMMNYYSIWNNKETIDLYPVSINDESITKHINKDIVSVQPEYFPIINIENLPNEEGYLMLWEISINDNKKYSDIIPVFINKDFVHRPLSGKKLWDIILKNQKEISINGYNAILKEDFDKLEVIAYEIGYDVFHKQKMRYQENNKLEYDRYIYALKLRLEAANKIGIPNIKNRRLKDLDLEKQEILLKYERNKYICPVFKPILTLQLER
jgi:SNF2 family DNA or RNA helicase